LGSKIAEWKTFWRIYSSNYLSFNTNKNKYQTPQGSVLLAGYVVQKFGIVGGKMAGAFNAFAELFAGCINEYVAKPLGQTASSNPSEAGSYYNIGEIPNYNSLIPIAMNAGKPVFDLLPVDFNTIDGGVTFPNNKKKLEDCKKEYEKSCQIILDLLEPLVP